MEASTRALDAAVREVADLAARAAQPGGGSAAGALAAKAEGIVATHVRELREVVEETRGLRRLTSEPGQDKQTLDAVATALESLGQAVDGDVKAVTSVTGRLLQADDAERATLARQIAEHVGGLAAAARQETASSLAELEPRSGPRCRPGSRSAPPRCARSPAAWRTPAAPGPCRAR